MKNKILLINKSESLRTVFKIALEKEQYIVTDFFAEQSRSFHPNSFDKFANVFHRFFLNDKSYLDAVRKKHEDKQLKLLAKQIIKQSSKFDYVLFFRADLYAKKIIEDLRKITQMMITYQYDGMEVCQNLLNFDDQFDRIFVFDKFDRIKYKERGFLPLTNCFFDEEKTDLILRDFFYVGVGIPERKKKIQDFVTYASSLERSLEAFLTVPGHHQESKRNGVHYVHKGFTYEQNMEYAKTSRCILDFKLPYHEGLSFRFFEAMNLEKKLITNNFSVKNYDFYHPDNIFICDYEDFSGLEEFMNTSYKKLDPKIVRKYNFSNWIRYVLDVEPYEKIELS